MQIDDFIAFHQSALEADEVRHSLLVSLLGRLRMHGTSSGVVTWTVGGPGECAMMQTGYPIVLGNLSAGQCRMLAEMTKDVPYPAVVGPDETALLFSECAARYGIGFGNRIPQRILALSSKPTAPRPPGRARRALFKDFDVFRAWTLAFLSEAIPEDPVPNEESLRISLGQRRHWFWIVDGTPVSMAAITRRSKNAASINAVFTPPEQRNKGFAGAITAAVARHIFREGRTTAALYADLRNPASNRCYAKLGFRPVCNSWHIIRDKPVGS
jgi:RimJ/RimL family protein N-acetyltransferase